MANSTNVGNGDFGQIINSLSDYVEVIVVLMILVLLAISFDEVVDFIYLIKDSFIYPAPPVCP